MSSSTDRPRAVIVGAGLGGTATAIRLLRSARDPLEVRVVERRADYRYAGAAYHADGNPWQHVFNIQAGRMSVFREDVDDFVNWANGEVPRTGWPQPWRDFHFVEQGPAPRRIYQLYLADRLAEAGREASRGVELVEHDGEVVDLTDGARGGIDVAIREGRDDDGAAQRLPADHVVLATGLEVKTPPFAAQVLSHPAFVREPYSRAGTERIEETSPDATVLVVGSVLSAYDTTALLLRRGHRGKIFLVSRSGSTLRTYPEDHTHEVIHLPRPDLAWDDAQGRDGFLEHLGAAWEAACSAVVHDHPEIDPAVVPERVAKAWEPYVPALLEQIPSDELRKLLNDFATPLATLRVGAMAYTTRIVEDAMSPARRQVELLVGGVVTVEPAAGGRLAVDVFHGWSQSTVTADLVVSNFGRESDYSRVTSLLWRNLLSRGTAAVHQRTGRGLEVDARGMLLGTDGHPTLPISAIGVLREGDEIMRNGRAGAFSFNLAAIKNHSVGAAAQVLQRVERYYGPRDAARPDGDAALARLTGEDDGARRLTTAVALEVRRLAARKRAAREAIAAELENCIQQLAKTGSPTEPEHLVYAIRRHVGRTAVDQLSDVSVTPRELRTNLKIAQ